MVWGEISVVVKTDLAVLTKLQNSIQSFETLKSYLLPFMKTFHDKKFIFQQDNEAIHKSKLAKS